MRFSLEIKDRIEALSYSDNLILQSLNAWNKESGFGMAAEVVRVKRAIKDNKLKPDYSEAIERILKAIKK